MRTAILSVTALLIWGCGGSQANVAPTGATAAFTAADADRLYTEGMAAWRAGDGATAESRLRSSLDANPRYLAAHLSLGALYLEGERFSDALARFDAAVGLRAHAADGHTGRARALVGLGRLDEAADAAALAATHAATSGSRAIEADAHEANGDVRYATGDIDAAIAAYERAIELDSTRATARLHLARCYVDQGRPADAVSLLGRGITPELGAETLTAFGAFFHAHSAYDRAVDVLLASNEARPGDVETLYLLASSYVRSGRSEPGLQRATEALAIDPGHVGALVVRGEAHLTRDFLPNAAADANAALGRAPDNYDALVLAGDVEFTRVRATLNATSATTAGEGAPAPEPDFSGAIAHYRRAIAVDAGSVRAYDHLARLYRDRSMWVDAAALLEPQMARPDAPSDWVPIMVAALRGSGRDREAAPYQSSLAMARRDDASLHYEAALAGLQFRDMIPAETALTHAQRAIEFAGAASLPYRMALVDALLLNDRRDEAARALDDAARIYPAAREIQQRRPLVR